MKEIIIIKEDIPKIKAFLDQEKINYEIYQEPNQKESLFSNYNQAVQDQLREQEAQELENAEEEDIVNEEW